jgi:transcriptional regulator with XRE-family HTH domain
MIRTFLLQKGAVSGNGIIPVFPGSKAIFSGQGVTASTFSKYLHALMTTEDVLEALGRYMRESNESDRRTAAMLGIKRATLIAWLQGADPPQKCILARLAGFLRRVGYL